MTETCKEYIKGVRGRGDEVIKTLEDLGAKNCQLDGDAPECLYFIDHEGLVSLALLDSEFGKIIMDDYRELHLPEKWKDGDILYNENDDVFAVVRDIHGYISTHIAINNGEIEKDFTFPKEDFRLVTPSEVERFHELLHKNGKEWDAEKKQLVDWKWKPKQEEDYWAVIIDVTIITFNFTWLGSETDKERYGLGNCFRTKAEAGAAAERVKKALKGE